MGKHLPFNRKYDVEIGEHQPGCFWGMLHVLDYHHWQYVKRLLQHKKHHPRRKLLRCCANPKTTSFTDGAGKEREHIDAESMHLLHQHHTEEGKSLVAKNISKEEIDKKRPLIFHVKELKHGHLVDGKMSCTDPCSTKLDEELFQRILHNPHLGVMKDFANECDAIGKPKFMKAKSFPVPDSAGIRRYKASTLKHKQSEVWFFPGGDMPKMGLSKFPEDCKISPVPFNGIIKQETTFSSLDSSQTLHNHGWNHLIISPLKGIKRRIRRALNESRKGSVPVEVRDDHRSSSDSMKEISNDRVQESKLQRMSRLSSLNESLDKYARLFEENFSVDSKATKLNNCKSLKLTGEDKTSEPKTFRRRLSLPDHETLSALLCDLSYDNLYSGLLCTTKPESNRSQELKLKSETLGSLHDFPKIDSTEISSGGRDENFILEQGHGSAGDGTEDQCGDGDIPGENPVGFAKRDSVVCHGEANVVSPRTTSEAEPSSPVSVLHSFLSHRKTEPAALCSSEGMESRPCGAPSDGNEAADIIFKGRDGMIKEDAAADFNFVNRVLKLGGFFENEFSEPWESMDLPLNPKLFDDLVFSDHHHKEECSEGHCAYQLLFDLINEALLDICERRFTYFPRVVSSRRFTRPVMKGQDLLEEVWTRVKWHRSMGPELDTTLDDIVGKDMGKGDRWMDLKWDGQCVALELEDMIFDELVTELLRC